MQPSIPDGAAAVFAPAFLALCLAAPAAAVQRAPGPFTPSADVKTAREPDTLPPWNAGVAPVTQPGPRATERGRSLDPKLPSRCSARIDHAHMYWDAPGDGSLWARGASYKASFGSNGATYVPWLGSSAPRDVEIALSPETVSLGATSLVFDRGAQPVRIGDRVEIDRGAFVEAYDLAPQSVEQTFVFDALPATGDLVIRLPLASEMEMSEVDGGIEMRSAHGRVTYGGAIAIDANGRRFEAATRLEDAALVVRVGAGLVAQAKLPLVIDPLVSTFPIATGSGNDALPDAEYDAMTDRWLVIFEEVFSATDRDVFAELLTSTGTPITGGYVDFTTMAWDHARCANMAAANQFLVVAGVTNGTAKTISGRTIQAATLSMSSQFPISNGEFGDLTNPDVGGDPYFGQAYYCVVYQRHYSATDDDILVRLVDSFGAAVGGTVYLSNSSGTQDIFPSISRSNGSATWAIAWERNVNDSSTGIWAGRINWNGNIAVTPFQIINYAFAYIPCVSSPLIGSQRNMIAYEGIVGGSAGDTYDILADVIDGGASIWFLDVSTQEWTDHSDRDQIEPQVDSDGQHFAVMYSETVPGSATDYNVFVTDLGMTGTNVFVSGPRTTLASTANPEHGPRIASAHAPGGPAYRYLAVWQASIGTNNNDVLGALYDGNEGGKAFGFCFGDGSGTACPCGNSGSSGHGCANSANSAGADMYASGSLSTIHDTTVLEASGLPPTSACLFFQAANPLQPPTAFGDGLRCITGSVIRLGTEVAAGGFAHYPGPGQPAISVIGGVPLDGTSEYYQCWYRNAASFCTSSTFNLTNAVIVEWGR